ncbi:GntR family transcriptional regulator [Microbacterium sp. SSW1-47]|uniref:GntR family transcriptional regulator n=1 Tax=Microbacterium sufflavum TaxID=2851649 RepID=UPI001FFCD93E|nr:GntR family transcriptional regulator [Microbacterium sufflavum]MCK2025646.1 GntR family transcriptional regulator [Microbacterium sufflavum]
MVKSGDAAASAKDRADALQKLAQRHGAGYRSVGAMAYDIIRDAILDGTLPPGMKLRQETLAESIGISRLPIRSALIQLEADGLVVFHARRGAMVRALSTEEAGEVYHLRMLLEKEALRLAMAEITPERVERLRELAKTADDISEGGEFVEARTAFYATLYDAQARPLLWEMIEQLRLKLGRYVLGWRLGPAGSHDHSHTELVDVVAAGDAKKALGVLEAHLTQVRDGVIALLDDAAAEGADNS